MSYHLVVTQPLPKHKVGTLITDPAEIKAIEGTRGVVKAFDHLTHVGVETAAKAAAAASAKIPAAPVV